MRTGGPEPGCISNSAGKGQPRESFRWVCRGSRHPTIVKENTNNKGSGYLGARCCARCFIAASFQTPWPRGQGLPAAFALPVPSARSTLLPLCKSLNHIPVRPSLITPLILFLTPTLPPLLRGCIFLQGSYIIL